MKNKTDENHSPKLAQHALQLEPIPTLDGVGRDILKVIQEHTSIEEDELKNALTFIIDTDTFEKYFKNLKQHNWVEEINSTWRLSRRGNAWLDLIGNSLTTEKEDLGEPDQLKKPYDVAKLKVEQRPFSVFQVLRKIEKKEIVLNPDFQRAFVWDEIRQSRLIESILIRIPLPVFYIDATDSVEWTVVDGLQRLNTLYNYCRNNSFELKGMEFLAELNGMRFSDLPKEYKVLIEDETQLIFNSLMPGTPIAAKFTIFSRVNTGGMELTAQEIRHALNQGQITIRLKKLSESDEFLNATGKAVDSRRMADQELILRALSFMQFGWTSYQNYAELDKFLVQTMSDFNDESKITEQDLNELGQVFLNSINKVKNIFQEYSFRKFSEIGGRRGPLNKALFEIWAVSVREYNEEILLKNKDQIIEKFLALLDDKDFNRAITSGTGKFLSVKKRFEAIENLLKEVCL
jgi:hypothetical protein